MFAVNKISSSFFPFFQKQIKWEKRRKTKVFFFFQFLLSVATFIFGYFTKRKKEKLKLKVINSHNDKKFGINKAANLFHCVIQIFHFFLLYIQIIWFFFLFNLLEYKIKCSAFFFSSTIYPKFFIFLLKNKNKNKAKKRKKSKIKLY